MCVATSIWNRAHKLHFFETMGTDEVFLVQSNFCALDDYFPSLSKIAIMSTDLTYCGESVLILFESGEKGAICTLTINDGGQIFKKSNYLPNYFEGEFLGFSEKDTSHIWTLDSSGALKRASKMYLLGKESELKFN